MNQYCHRQSSKSSVTLGAVWQTLTLAGEGQRPRRPVIHHTWTPTKWIFQENYVVLVDFASKFHILLRIRAGLC